MLLRAMMKIEKNRLDNAKLIADVLAKQEKIKLDALTLKNETETKLKKAEEELKAKEKELLEAQEEDKIRHDEATVKIKDVASSLGYFCGIILTKQDILNLLNQMIDNPGNISVEFNLYKISE